MQNHRFDQHTYNDGERPVRHFLHDAPFDLHSDNLLTAEVAPGRTTFAAGLLGMIGVGAFAAAIAGAGALNSCTAQPVAFRFGERATVEMAVAKGSRCSLQVKTGTARIDDLVVESQASSGDVFARGRTGVIYQPLAHFTGNDSFTFALQGRTDRGWSRMTVRVGVVVK